MFRQKAKKASNGQQKHQTTSHAKLTKVKLHSHRKYTSSLIGPTAPDIFSPPINLDDTSHDAYSIIVDDLSALPSTAFQSTAPQHKFTRIIDASLSKQNQMAKKKVAVEFENSRIELLKKHHNNDEFFHLLNDAEAQAARHKARIERKQRSKDTAHPFTSYNFSVTILGRPNVGKSSLFNRLTGKALSMVHNSSGVTRDWNDSFGKLANLEFRIIDTAGLQEIDFSTSNPTLDPDKIETHHKTGDIYGKEFGAAIHAEERSGTSKLVTKRNKSGKSRLNIPKSAQNSNYVLGRPLTPELQQSILDLTSKAIQLSDIVIFMIDAKIGITQQDIHFARWVRKQLHKKHVKSTKSIEPLMTDVNGGENINITQINKLYELIATEMLSDQEKYKNDITLFPLLSFFDETHVHYEDILHVNHTNRSFLRSIHTKPVLLLANKYDHGDSTQDYTITKHNPSTNKVEKETISITAEENLAYEAHQLGFGQDVEPIPFSAVHGVGLGELYSKMVYSMSSVLKQWDTYQKKIKYILDVKTEYDAAIKVKETKEKKLRAQQEKATVLTQQSEDEKPLTRRDKMLLRAKQAKLEKQQAMQLEYEVMNDEELTQFRQESLKKLQKTGVYSDFFPVDDSNEESMSVARHRQMEDNNTEYDQNIPEMASNEETNEEVTEYYDHSSVDDHDHEHSLYSEEGDNLSKEQNQEQFLHLSKAERRKARRLKSDELPLDMSMIPDADFVDVELPKVVENQIFHTPGTSNEKEHKVKFVLVGKPNAGKSTLMNALLGDQRVLTGPQAGVTRDSIEIQYDDDSKYPNHSFHLVDTAGLKGITQHQHSRYDLVDSSAMQNTVKKIQQANVVGLVIDIAEGLYGNTGVDPVFTHQIQKNFIENVQAIRYDERYEKAKAAGASEEELALMKRKHTAEKSAYDDKLAMMVSRVAGCVTKHDMDIARLAAEHGKALMVLANKIDCLKGGQREVDAVMKGLLALFSFTYSQNKGITVVPVSAKQSTNVPAIMGKVTSLYDKWNSRINTGLLNRWMQALLQMSPPPNIGMKHLSLKYVTQTNVRPPTFALFVNRKAEFPQSYERFVRNSLINEFGLQGVPIRLNIRTGDNPYVEQRTISNAEKFHRKKQREKDEIIKAKQQRSGKNSRMVYAKLTKKAKKLDNNAQNDSNDDYSSDSYHESYGSYEDFKKSAFEKQKTQV